AIVVMDYILEIKNLSTYFFTRAGTVKAVDAVSFAIERGSTLALVGESGSGKSVASLSIMRLVQPPGKSVAGEIIFNGRDLMKLTDDEMRRIRGREIAMIFQDPMTSLNPVYTVGDQIAEAIQLHEKLGRSDAWERAVEMMRRVKIPDAHRRAADYPYQLSGGMRQRVMIAMALSCNPKLLIADEPTTALDVTIQAEILDLLRELKEDFHLSMLLITHDLGVVAETADRVAVMYAGRIVEQAMVREIFHNPRHPYTEGLLRSVPKLTKEGLKVRRLETIEGTVPSMLALPAGCKFAPRCSYVIDECTMGEPELMAVNDEHRARCIRFEVVGDESARTHPERSGGLPLDQRVA
ncbi:MAG TPA: ABC transporter ATP-binding protein, partial [Blastocatellia bacterium]|nr:ABC transporter ATP-binding protein [Blastocatellia bacterium]